MKTKVLSIICLCLLLVGCSSNKKPLTEYDHLDTSFKQYASIDEKTYVGDTFEIKVESVHVNYEEELKYLFTIYVTPLYDQNIRIRYITCKPTNTQIEKFYNSGQFQIANTGKIGIKIGKENFDLWKEWTNIGEFKSIPVVVGIREIGKKELEEAGLSEQIFKEAMSDLNITIYYESSHIKNKDVIHVESLQSKELSKEENYNRKDYNALVREGFLEYPDVKTYEELGK